MMFKVYSGSTAVSLLMRSMAMSTAGLVPLESYPPPLEVMYSTCKGVVLSLLSTAHRARPGSSENANT